jgi:hypothetical protein
MNQFPSAWREPPLIESANAQANPAQVNLLMTLAPFEIQETRFVSVKSVKRD